KPGSEEMDTLARARAVYRQLLSQRNGHAAIVESTQSGYDINDRNDQSSPALLADGSRAPCFRLIRNVAELHDVTSTLDAGRVVGLDIETTGLNPRTDRVRLLTLVLDDAPPFIIDCFALDPAPVFKALASKPIIAHNAAFDMAFLAASGFTAQAPMHD